MFQDFTKKLLQELREEEMKRDPTQQLLEIPKIETTFTLEVQDVEVTLSDQSPGIGLFATVEEIQTQENLEELYTSLLRGNFLGQATRKASLGLDDEGKKVILSYQPSSIRSYRDFRDTVEDFVNVVCFWKNQISQKWGVKKE